MLNAGNLSPTLCGLKVVTSPFVPDTVPRIQVRDIKLRDGTPILTPAFRADMNRWLLERFGTVNVAFMPDDPRAIVIGSRLKEALDRELAHSLVYGFAPRG